LALDRGEKTGAEIAGAMNRDRYGLCILGENVVAAMNAIERPPTSLQLRDDLFARHISHDRSQVIYTQHPSGRRMAAHTAGR